ncbi:MAG: Fic family protein [Clostridiales Family XIII bacterium]|jgi:hypothetical protein|nr:Fic family protein [Clostridiales Family XIII bacterium]
MKFQRKYDMTRNENIEYAKRNVVDYIWKSARLEGLNVTFPQTYAIYEQAKLQNVDIDTVVTIINLKNAWRLMIDTIGDELDIEYIKKIHAEVSRGEALSWGKLRTGDVGIGGTKYKPSIPIEDDVSLQIAKILDNDNPIDSSLDLMLYGMRSQLFWDGNKRTSMLIANKILIGNGCGIISVDNDDLLEFGELLSTFYETGNADKLKEFLYNKCIDGTDFSKGRSKVDDFEVV